MFIDIPKPIGGIGGGSKTKTGSFSSSSTTYKLTLDFKPKQICIYRGDGTVWSMSYDENYSTTKYYKCVGSSSSVPNIGTGSTNFHLVSIDDDGVTLSFKDSTYAGYDWRYYAIG